MEIIAIIIIGIIALCIQVTYERRRTATNLEFQHQRLAAEAKNWADILEKATITTSASASVIIAKSMAEVEASGKRWREAEAQRQKAVADAERQRYENAKNRKPAPVGVFGGDGVYREAGQPVVWYDIRTDQWKDRSGQVVPDPRQNARMQALYGGTSMMDPRTVGARISTVDLGYESDMEAQARRASQSAMMDAIATGTGMMRISSEGAEHVPAAQYQGGGGSFDGGGASGDYTPAPSSCDSSSSYSSSDSSSSCSSSDSGSSSSSD
jgi:hypothetical protein